MLCESKIWQRLGQEKNGIYVAAFCPHAAVDRQVACEALSCIVVARYCLTSSCSRKKQWKPYLSSQSASPSLHFSSFHLVNRVQTVSLYHFRLNQQTWRDKHRRIFSIFIGPMWRWGHHVCVMFMLSNFVTSIKNTIKINHCSLCDNLQQSMCDILCTIWRGISLVQVFSRLTFALKTNSFIFFF